MNKHKAGKEVKKMSRTIERLGLIGVAAATLTAGAVAKDQLIPTVSAAAQRIGIVEPATPRVNSAAAGDKGKKVTVNGREFSMDELSQIVGAQIKGNSTGARVEAQLGIKSENRLITPGESFDAPAGSIIMGDVKVGGIAHFDNDGKTGLVVILKKGGRVDAPFGGGMQFNIDPADRIGQLAAENKAQMEHTGCENNAGCLRVDVLDLNPDGTKADSSPAAPAKPATKPAAVATAVPKGAERGQAEVDGVTDHIMKPGEEYKTPRRSVVAGDVFVNGKRLFDNREETGLVVEAETGDVIIAPFGADVTLLGENDDRVTEGNIVGDIVEGLKESGCGLPNGCERVEVVKSGSARAVAARPTAAPIVGGK